MSKLISFLLLVVMLTSGEATQGDDYYAKAQEKMKWMGWSSGGWWPYWWPGSWVAFYGPDYEVAADLFIEAAKAYEEAKDGEKCFITRKKAAEAYQKHATWFLSYLYTEKIAGFEKKAADQQSLAKECYLDWTEKAVLRVQAGNWTEASKALTRSLAEDSGNICGRAVALALVQPLAGNYNDEFDWKAKCDDDQKTDATNLHIDDLIQSNELKNQAQNTRVLLEVMNGKWSEATKYLTFAR